MNEPQRQQTKVSLEDLLHLKRTERPTPAFWTQFEQEMRAKQLSALVRKDPWWRALPAALTRSPRLHLPLGATAVFALAIVTVREFRHPGNLQLGAPSKAVEASALAADGTSGALIPFSQFVDSHPAAIVGSVGSDNLTAASYRSTELASDTAPLPVREDEREAEPTVNRSRAGTSDLSPSARSIAANRAAAEVSEPGLAQFLDHAHEFENVFVSDKSSSIEPLTQVTTPRDTRRARLLASAVPTDIHSPENSAARSRERITSHLHEESLYDSITRLGLNGDRVSIKF